LKAASVLADNASASFLAEALDQLNSGFGRRHERQVLTRDAAPHAQSREHRGEQRTVCGGPEGVSAEEETGRPTRSGISGASCLSGRSERCAQTAGGVSRIITRLRDPKSLRR
jgi:hypothetical protein